MIFLLLNIVCAAGLFFLSFILDFKHSDDKNKIFINMLLLQAASAIITAFCILFILSEQRGLLSSFGRFFIWAPSLQSIAVFVWCCRFPEPKRQLLWRVVLIGGFALSFYAVFFLMDAVYFDETRRLIVLSKEIAGLHLDWFSFYKIMTVYVVPTITALVLFFKYELFSDRLLKQHMLFFIGALCAGEILYSFINIAASLPGHHMFVTMLPFVYSFVLFLFYAIQRNMSFLPPAVVWRRVSVFFLMYGLPSLLTALIFAFCLPLAEKNYMLFFVLILVSTSVIFFLFYLLRRRILRSERYNDSFYADRMEKEFTELDFTDIDIEVDRRFVQILQRNLNTKNVIILTENDERRLTTRYSSNGIQAEFDLESSVFLSLLNLQRRVVFKTHCTTVHELSPIASRLTTMFEQTDSSVMILLNEGAHLFALILLGDKKMEQPYTEYDYKVLNDLYSRFFLTGYYLNNIANEELIGLVGREIRFSSQVIQSLRQKTDIPIHRGCDADSVSLSARSLGSGFTDFIKLDTNRYIGVIGDLSGKGLNASMLMAILKSMIPIFLTETKDFKNLIQTVNLFIRENLPRGTYFAGMFYLMDMKAKTLYYANCALAALFMYNKIYDNMIEIQGEGKVLGFVPDVSSLIKVKKVQLNSGDMIVAVTKGVMEARSLQGEQFGKNRVQQTILQHVKQPASKLCELLSSAVKEFADMELEEDASTAVLKIL